MFNTIKKFFSAEPEVTIERIPGRNEACHCGSEKKYKACCLPKDQRKGLR